MSVNFQSSQGFVLCHQTYLTQLYASARKGNELIKLSVHPDLFLIKTPYLKDAEAKKMVKESHTSQNDQASKRKYAEISTHTLITPEIDRIKNIYGQLLKDAKEVKEFGLISAPIDILDNNRNARMISEKLYKDSSGWITAPFNGENNSNEILMMKVGSELFIFPPFCKFFCRDVSEIKSNLDSLGKFDLILLDPPWWNKYIRRKKAKAVQQGYKMMYNDCLGELPLNDLLATGGIIAVWCTNSNSNLDELREKLFPSWGTKQIAQWTWLKVTQSGHPVCPFSEPPGKQPFERLIFGVRSEEIDLLSRPEDGKVFLSVPSAIHSHKPPISEVMKPFLPPEPRCLEIFARYLLPNWTSWGLEVIKLQHQSLFHEEKTINE